VLIRRAEVEGQVRDVRIAEGRIEAIAEQITPRAGEAAIDAEGGGVLPGLHDHHAHLLALAAALGSVACGPPAVLDGSALASVLRAAAGISCAASATTSRSQARSTGPPRCVAARPAGSNQHRAERSWMLNSPAIDRLGLDRGADAPGVRARRQQPRRRPPLPPGRLVARAPRAGRSRSGARRTPARARVTGSPMRRPTPTPALALLEAAVAGALHNGSP
jgi:imidazolonepropionase-like amidohydrolase